MKVPQYRESQSFGAMPDVRLSVDGRALASAAGGRAWAAVDLAGRHIQTLGDQAGGVALDRMREHNEAVAMARLTEAEAAILDLQSAQARRKGRDALGDAGVGGAAGRGADGAEEGEKNAGVADSVRSGLSALRATLTRDLNPAQKHLFELGFHDREQGVMNWGAAYEAQQREAWQTGVEDDLLSVEARRALEHCGEWEQVDAALGNTLFAVERRGRRLGLSPEALNTQRREASRKLLMPVFQALLDGGEPERAQACLQRFGGDLGEESSARVQARIQSRLRARAEASAVRAEADRNHARAEAGRASVRGAVDEILAEVADFPDVQSGNRAALARLDALPDPGVREGARAEIAREMAWRQTRQDADDMRAALRVFEQTRAEASPSARRRSLDAAGLSERARGLVADWERATDETAEPERSLERTMTLLRGVDQSRREGRALTEDEVLAACLYGGLSADRTRQVLGYAADNGPAPLSRLDDVCVDLGMPPNGRGRVEAPAWLYAGVMEDLGRNGLLGEGKLLSDETLASSVTRVWQRRQTVLAARGPDTVAAAAGDVESYQGMAERLRRQTGEDLRERAPTPPPSWSKLFQHGMQDSVSGLAIRDKLPDILTPRELEHLSMIDRLVLRSGQTLGDSPTLLIGGALGAWGGSAARVTVPAGALGLTEGTRTMLENHIRYGEPLSLKAFGHHVGESMKATLKGMVVGGTMGAAGGAAGTAVRSAGGGKLAQTAGELVAETATLPVAAAAVEGRMPEAEDFADAAVLILGMKGLGGAGKAVGRAMGAGKSALEARLRTIHEKTGIAPERVARETRHDPTLLDELLDPRKPVPEAFTAEAAEVEPAYQTVLRELYSDDRTIKMVFRETGVEPSLTERTQLREYLESLDPKEVKRLKLESPQDYLAVMKAITRKFFPREGELRFRRNEDGRTLDYQHFVGRDTPRNEYLATLPDTLKTQDIRVEFTTTEGEAKAYLIRKYFDAELQSDVWDMLVIRAGELKTKIARKEKKGRIYIESIINRAGSEASQPTTAGGAIESASTPRDVTATN